MSQATKCNVTEIDSISDLNSTIKDNELVEREDVSVVYHQVKTQPNLTCSASSASSSYSTSSSTSSPITSTTTTTGEVPESNTRANKTPSSTTKIMENENIYKAISEDVEIFFRPTMVISFTQNSSLSKSKSEHYEKKTNNENIKTKHSFGAHIQNRKRPYSSPNESAPKGTGHATHNSPGFTTARSPSNSRRREEKNLWSFIRPLSARLRSPSLLKTKSPCSSPHATNDDAQISTTISSNLSETDPSKSVEHSFKSMEKKRNRQRIDQNEKESFFEVVTHHRALQDLYYSSCVKKSDPSWTEPTKRKKKNNNKLPVLPNSLFNSKNSSCSINPEKYRSFLPQLKPCHIKLFLQFYDHYFRPHLSAKQRRQQLHNSWRLSNDTNYVYHRKFMVGIAILIHFRLKDKTKINQPIFDLHTKAKDVIFEFLIRKAGSVQVA